MAMKLLSTITLIIVLASNVREAKGFTITPPMSPACIGGATFSETARYPAAAIIALNPRTRISRPVTFLSMAAESDDESRQTKRRNQQLGAAAVVLFGVLYDFFVTHHGIGFWDPNYIV
jgi:hypothetical protein